MNIQNFSAGIISSAAFSRHRDFSAADAINVRHDDEGALEVRAGYKRLPSDGRQIVAIFVHIGYVLALMSDGELQWETESNLLTTPLEDSVFRSFIPARTGFDTQGTTRFVPHDDIVFISNRNHQLKVILEDPPIAYPFYVAPIENVLGVSYTGGATWQDYSSNYLGEHESHPEAVGQGTIATNARYYNTAESVWYQYRSFPANVKKWVKVAGPENWLGHFESRTAAAASGREGVAFTGEQIEVLSGNTEGVFLRFQPVVTIPQEDTAYLNYPIEAVGRTSVTAGRVPTSVVTLSILDGAFNDLEAVTDADYIDIYQTESTAVNADAEFFFIGRIPYEVGEHSVSVREDVDILTAPLLVEPLDEVYWTISEFSNDRLYLFSPDHPSRIWISYYDSNIRYFRSLTDYIDINTRNSRITAIKTIGEDTVAIYTEQSIFLMTTDPIGELHRVYEVIATRGDKDAAIGCIAPESLVDIEGLHYFLSVDRQVYRFGGRRTQWISEAVNPTLASVPPAAARKAVGFARGREYCLCYPSTPASSSNDAMIVFDTQRNIWWRDDLAISAVSKGGLQREYALRNGFPILLQNGIIDGTRAIEWYWRGNKILIPLNTLVHSLFIGVIPEDVGDDPLEISVALRTEEGEQVRTLNVDGALNYWQQYIGFNLRGRSLQVTLSGSGLMKIDRLIFNPKA